MDFDEDDLPAGYQSLWDELVEALRTFPARSVTKQQLGLAMKHPEAEAVMKQRYQTEKWKEQHRKHARESARRRRAAARAR